MTHCMKRYFAAFGAALLFLLLSGCAGTGGGVLVLPDTSDPATKTTWQELLTEKMNKKRPDDEKFQYYRADDAAAEKLLAHVKECSKDNAGHAEELLSESGETGCAVDAAELREALNVQTSEKTRLVGYAVVPQGCEGTMNDETAGRLAKDIIRHRCFLSKGPGEEQTETGRVGFAMGEIGTKMFVIALFQ